MHELNTLPVLFAERCLDFSCPHFPFLSLASSSCGFSRLVHLGLVFRQGAMPVGLALQTRIWLLTVLLRIALCPVASQSPPPLPTLDSPPAAPPRPLSAHCRAAPPAPGSPVPTATISRERTALSHQIIFQGGNLREKSQMRWPGHEGEPAVDSPLLAVCGRYRSTRTRRCRSAGSQGSAPWTKASLRGHDTRGSVSTALLADRSLSVSLSVSLSLS